MIDFRGIGWEQLIAADSSWGQLMPSDNPI